MVVGALVSALFISCGKNPSEPGTEGNSGADSVPNFTGDPATDLPNGYYRGTLSYKSHNISEFSVDGQTKEDTEQDIMSGIPLFYLKIDNNILKCSEYSEQEMETAEGIQALKSGSEYGATISYETNDEDGNIKDKRTIRFTISDNTISITYIKGQSVDATGIKYSYDATYEGTLTKYTPTTTPSGI